MNKHMEQITLATMLRSPILLLLIGVATCFGYFFHTFFSQGLIHKLVVFSPIFGLSLVFISTIFLVYRILAYITYSYEDHFRKQNSYFRLFFPIIRRILLAVLLLVVVNIAIHLLPLSPHAQQIVSYIVNALLFMFAGWFVLQCLELAEQGFYSYSIHVKHLTPKHLNSQITKIRILRQIFSAFTIVLTFAAILMMFNGLKTLGISLLASAGFLTAMIGFAAQKPLSAIFTNFTLAFSQPIKIDDAVVINNEVGNIEEIRMNYVVVKLWDNRRLIVPSSYFIENSFQNWSYKNTNLIGTVFLYVDYGIPIKKLREALHNILNKTELWDKQVANLEVTECKENCVQIRVLVSALPEQVWSLRVLVREQLLEFINEHYSEYLPAQRIYNSSLAAEVVNTAAIDQ